MNKHSYGIIILIMLYFFSMLTYKSLFIPDTPLLSEVGTAVEESVNNPESSLPISKDAVTGEDGQASKIEVVGPSKVIAKAPTATAGNPSSPIAASTPPVSRGSQPANTYKYPLLSKVNGSFGQFHYRDLSGGRIEVDPQWIASNIVTITLPGLNQRVQVNKAAAANFIQAFTLIKNGTATVNGRQVSLLSLIKTMDGTFVTRHVNWNPANGLSNHSWGTAIDINADGHFGYIDPSRQINDPNLILWEKAFKPAGFSWGNRYSDSMHYELLK